MNDKQDPLRESQNVLELLQANQVRYPPVLVVGMHNSGTSMLTEILHKSGIFFSGNMQHYESHFFSIFINDKLIMGGGSGWAKLPLMTIEEVLACEPTIGPIIKLNWLADYLQWGYDGISPWGIKDPRLCVLLPLYLKLFPGAKVIHILRRPEDVAASLSGKYKAGVGIRDDFEHWKALTEAYTGRVLDYAGNLSTYFQLSYEEFCLNPEPLAKELFRFLNLAFSKHTEQLLNNVKPDRIGSYQEMLEARRHPLRTKIKSWLRILSH